jgi:hypothetical protein
MQKKTSRGPLMQPKRSEDSPPVFLVKAGNDGADF